VIISNNREWTFTQFANNTKQRRPGVKSVRRRKLPLYNKQLKISDQRKLLALKILFLSLIVRQKREKFQVQTLHCLDENYLTTGKFSGSPKFVGWGAN